MLNIMIILFHPKIRQILLHWGYELVKSDCFYNNFFVRI